MIDAESQCYESDAGLEQCFDGPYKGHRRSGVFSIFPSLDGWPRGFVRGLDKVNRATAEVWVEFIEGSKIDAAVLYPTAGLSFGLIQDPDWACVVAAHITIGSMTSIAMSTRGSKAWRCSPCIIPKKAPTSYAALLKSKVWSPA